jgi:hypothetical protein
MRCVTGLVAVTAMTLALACVSHASSGSRPGVLWSHTQAEARILHAPPRRWTNRGWTVPAAVCTGLGSPTLVPEKRKAAGPPLLLRLFQNFSCEITVVRPDPICTSRGIYDCVAGWETTAEERTLHVLDETHYALYRHASS